MKRKTDVRELRIGMRVVELDRPWLETPFLFQGFEIRTEEEIEQLQRYCRHVYILDSHSPHTASASAGNDRLLQIEHELLRINNHPAARPRYQEVTALEEEIGRIKDAYQAARALIRELMQDARLGRRPDATGAKAVVAELTESVIRNPDALTCFAQLRKKDEDTVLHSLRVCILALVFGRQLGFDRDALNVLGIGALLHDIGKVRVPDEILRKPTTLNARETEIMRQHVAWGVAILEGSPGIPAAAVEVARCHHERYDGRGYPAGLPGETISTFGLIGGIVNWYDDITSDDVRHIGVSPHAALRRLYEERGKAFQPALVEQFIQCLGIYPVGSVVELNTGEVAVVAALNRVRRLKPRVILVRRPDGTPYPATPAVNLESRITRSGIPCEIERALETVACGINPAYYLPVPPLG